MNVGFVSGRIAGTDGVSLETAKWAAVLEGMGHAIYYCAGELERDGPPGLLVPEMYFHTPDADWIVDHAYGTTTPHPDLYPMIDRYARAFRERLDAFVAQYGIDLIIPENALTIPIQIALGVALTDLIEETGIPTIAHHHDFYWEREVYKVNCIPDIIARCFPPDSPSIRHVVINSLAQRDLRARCGIDSVVVPNVFDFAVPAPGIDDYNADLRAGIGLTDEDLLILQPTRIIRRKGIELAIELVGRLRDPRCKLVLSHATDVDPDYLAELRALAEEWEVDLRVPIDRIDSVRTEREGVRVYGLWDVYPHADFVTYPSLYEGFGNALIEAIYFRLPALVNRYSVYAADIGPLGFDFVEIDGRVTDEAVAATRALLDDPELRRRTVDRNYALASEHFSYQAVERQLAPLLASFGD
ncbi:MAG: glycosyltransferase family 4 protein [Anaerolineae bacterium]|nr:glycosyltransferase family 4 protein [Anaerolineae bacterium]